MKLNVKEWAIFAALMTLMVGLIYLIITLALPVTASPAPFVSDQTVSFPVSTEQCPASSTGWTIVSEVVCLKGK